MHRVDIYPEGVIEILGEAEIPLKGIVICTSDGWMLYSNEPEYCAKMIKEKFGQEVSK